MAKMGMRMLLLVSLIAASTWLNPVHGHAGCGFHDPETSLEMAETIARKKLARQSIGPGVLCSGCIEIDTYVVVFRSSAGGGNDVTQAVIDEQMRILNDRFVGSPFTFALRGTRFVVNDNYHLNEWSDAEAIGKEYRQGDLSTLNLYFGGAAGGSEAYFPPIKADRQSFWVGDGAYVAIDTVPGGSSECCNLGLTVVHEVGHWLGLHHTFAGFGQFKDDACNPNNPQDFVDDTPQQGSFTRYECPERANTCPNMPGDDPIHNYMDYSSDDCYEEFTLGQIQRMYYVWALYRAVIDTCPSGYMEFELILTTDRNPEETQWTLVSKDGFFEWSTRGSISGLDDDGFEVPNSAHTYDVCIPTQKEYTFTITDSAGDGLNGQGRYTVSVGGTVIKEGRTFGSSEQTDFDTIVEPILPQSEIKEVQTWTQTNPFNGDSKPTAVYHDKDILWVFGRAPARVSQLNPATGELLETPMVLSGQCPSQSCGVDRISVFLDPNDRVAFFIMVVIDETDEQEARMLRYDTTYKEFLWTVTFDSTQVNDDDFGERLLPSGVGSPVISNDGSVVFINQQAGAYSAFDAFDGANLWSREAPFPLSGFALSADDDFLYASTVLITSDEIDLEQPSLFEISTSDGDISFMWNYTCDSGDCPGGVALTPTVMGNKLYVNDLFFGNVRFDVETLEPDYTSSTSSFFIPGPSAHIAISKDGLTMYTAEGFSTLSNPAVPNFVPKFVNTDNNANRFLGDRNNPIRGNAMLEIRLSPDESKVFYVTDLEAVGLLTSDGSLYYQSESFNEARSVDFDDKFTAFFITDADGVRAYSTIPTTAAPTQSPTPAPTPTPTPVPTPPPTPPLGRSDAAAMRISVCFVLIISLLAIL